MDYPGPGARLLLAALAAAALAMAAPSPVPASPASPAPTALAPRAAASSAITRIPHSRPVPGRVLRAYDPPAQRWLPGHRGVDLAAPPGAIVRSSADGVVHFAGSVAGTPTVSVLHADGIRTTYQPVIASVARGDAVRRGQDIGVLGAGGDPGLHWGALRGRDYLNPLDLLARRPIVLKPPVPDGR